MFQNLIHTMCITHVFLGDPNLEPKFPTICLPCFFFGLFVTSRWLGIKASAVVQKSSRVLHLCLEAQGVTSGSSQNLQSISSSVLHYCNQLVRMDQGLTKLMVKVDAWNLSIQPNYIQSIAPFGVELLWSKTVKPRAASAVWQK